MNTSLDEQVIVGELTQRVPQYFGQVRNITSFESHASSKRYFAIETVQGVVVGSYLDNSAENSQFVAIAQHLAQSGIRTPEVYYHDAAFIIQEYLGADNLVEWFDKESVHLSNTQSSQLLNDLIKDATLLAADIHARTTVDDLSLEDFITTTAIRDSELFSKYWGDDSVGGELLQLINELQSIPAEWIKFCHRDYQLRNIMTHHSDRSELVVIDFQSALRGPITYDLASLIFSSRYSFNDEEIHEFLEHYVRYSHDSYGLVYELDTLEKYLYITGILRVIQAVAAYKRSMSVTGKNFHSQIARGLKNLEIVIRKLESSYGYSLPNLSAFLQRNTNPPTLRKLPVVIRSFSYEQEGLPRLNKRHVNIMLDLRTFSNPGRIPEYRPLTGKDAQTIKYLEQFPEVHRLRESLAGLMEAYYLGNYEFSATIDQVSLYLGCNGGRHRSVYFAEVVYREVKRLLGDTGAKISIKHPNIEAR